VLWPEHQLCVFHRLCLVLALPQPPSPHRWYLEGALAL
jgi:hypothetical protein